MVFREQLSPFEPLEIHAVPADMRRAVKIDAGQRG